MQSAPARMTGSAGTVWFALSVQSRARVSTGTAPDEIRVSTSVRTPSMSLATTNPAPSCCARSGREARSSWTVPTVRAKRKKAYTIPLSESAIDLLKRMEAIKTGSFVFPGLKRGSRISDTSLRNVLAQGRGERAWHALLVPRLGWRGDPLSDRWGCAASKRTDADVVPVRISERKTPLAATSKLSTRKNRRRPLPGLV